MPKFYNYIVTDSRNKSLLIRIIGLYNIKNKHQDFNVAIIENIIVNDMSCTLFELNGSKLVRQVVDTGIPEKNERKVLNDLDFIQSQNCLSFSYSERNFLEKIIKNDLELLTSLDAVEYNLLIAIIDGWNKIGLTNRFLRHYFDGREKKMYAICIVNIFTSSKMISPKHLKKIGGVKEYADRFMNLLKNITFSESL